MDISLILQDISSQEPRQLHIPVTPQDVAPHNPAMKAVAYARYSSDLQKPCSIGDQQALCRKYCARSGYTIIAEYADAAQSGSDTRDRLGYQALMPKPGRLTR